MTNGILFNFFPFLFSQKKKKSQHTKRKKKEKMPWNIFRKAKIRPKAPPLRDKMNENEKEVKLASIC